jgi:hypothetical protein
MFIVQATGQHWCTFYLVIVKNDFIEEVPERIFDIDWLGF